MDSKRLAGCVAWALVFCSALVAVAEAGNLYRWTDQNGKLHISDMPPPAGVTTEKIAPPAAQSGIAKQKPEVLERDAEAKAAADAQRQRLLDAANRAESERKVREREMSDQEDRNKERQREERQAQKQADKCKRLKELTYSAPGFQSNYDINCR